jgi:hypothetical protein
MWAPAPIAHLRPDDHVAAVRVLGDHDTGVDGTTCGEPSSLRPPGASIRKGAP